MRRAVETIAAGVFAGLLAALLAWSPAHADQAAEGAAEDAALALVTTLVDESHAAMEANDTEALKEAISRGFAFEVWERFLLGEADLASGRRQTFRRLLPGFLASLYAERFGKGLEGVPEVAGARPIRRDVLVMARIPRADAAPLPVEYRVREFEEHGPRVIDIMVGGVSFLVLKRDEFGAILERGGPEALLDHMRESSI